MAWKLYKNTKVKRGRKEGIKKKHAEDSCQNGNTDVKNTSKVHFCAKHITSALTQGEIRPRKNKNRISEER